MFSSAELKKIIAEARPIIERQLDDAERIAGFRDVVAEKGGDWSALKALIKAQIKDERDESGDGKHVRKILDKADFSTAYAEMLGWANMNEKNFSAETGSDEDRHPADVAQPAEQAAHNGEVAGSNPAVSTNSTRAGATPPPSPSATGDTAAPVSPTHSHPAATAAREAGSTGEGGASYALASPVNSGASHGDDDLDPPAHMVRANWVDGMPPR